MARGTNQTAEVATPLDQGDAAKPEVIDQPLFEPATKADAPTDADPVMRATEYKYMHYQAGNEFTDRMAIGHLFSTGFNPAPYDFRWVRYDQVPSIAQRYLVLVSKTLHSKWFKPSAFHHSGNICCGEENMNGKQPEFYLAVRAKEALIAEREQMLQRSHEKRNPNAEGVEAVVNGIGRAIGTEYVRGGLTHSPMGGWGK